VQGGEGCVDLPVCPLDKFLIESPKELAGTERGCCAGVGEGQRWDNRWGARGAGEGEKVGGG